MGFTYREAYNLPSWQRSWFITRISEEMDKARKANSDASRAAHHNTPDVRAMQGRQREQVPAKLRRFT